MGTLTTENSIFMLCAEKDVLCGALRVAPESRERDSILQLIGRVGMADTEVCFTAAQRQFISANGAALMVSEKQKGSKYDTPVARRIMDAIVARMSAS